MGRNKSEVWKHFYTQNKEAKCKYCGKTYFSNVNKITFHLLRCFKCPPDIKNSFKNEKLVAKCTVRENTSDVEVLCDNNDAVETVQSLNSKQTNVVLLSKPENVTLSKMLARAIYVSGSPLSLVEHPVWLKFFERLQPSFKLPSRRQLATNLLEEEYQTVKSSIAEQLNCAQNLHLQCDGWSNIRNEGVINFVISKPDPVFVEFLMTEDKRHTAEYLQEQMQIILEKYQPEKFLVVIEDNAANMQKAFRLLRVKYNHIVPLGCIAHTLHLSCNDIIKCRPVKDLIEKSTDVIKTIKWSQVLSAFLCKINKEKGVTASLKLPAKTRWGSYIFSLESLVTNKVSLQTLAVNESSSLSKEIKLILLDEDCFWKDIVIIIEIIKPIVLWITKFESNKCLIHKVHTVFKELQNSMHTLLETRQIRLLNELDKQQLIDKFEERMQFAQSPIYLAAALLDPSNQGCQLSDSEQITAMEFIYNVSRNMGVDVMSELALYRSKEDIWGKEFIWSSASSIEPLIWWKGLCAGKCLSKVAARILSAPVTSAATERSFSTFSWIHSKKRNRLITERAAKLTCISHNWSLSEANQSSRETNEPGCSHWNDKTTSSSRSSESLMNISNSTDSD